jgi:hypothetical protein
MVSTRLRQVPPLAYLFLGFSFLGVASELTYHFLPPATIPAFGNWLAGLSAEDHDFFYLSWELSAHICIAVGLMGMVTMVVYRYMSQASVK